MNHAQDQNVSLERLVDGVLKMQPPLPAPRTLAMRVLAEIERRSALPWWRKDFLHWPVAARIALLAASCAAVAIALYFVNWAATAHPALPIGALASPLAWMQSAAGVVSSLTSAAVDVRAAVPPHLLYLILGLGAALYAALFGIGAVAYRTLCK